MNNHTKIKLSIGEKHTVRDMFMMSSYEATIHEFATWANEDGVILKRKGKFSFGQINFIRQNNSIILQIRATSWHKTIHQLKKYREQTWKNKFIIKK